VTLFRIALRNVLKNRRRSAITVLAIAFGFMAVAMFRGYTHQAYEKIALGAIFVEVPGHLAVVKRGFFQEGKLFPERYLFSREEAEQIQEIAASTPGVVWSAQKLQITGLVSNGDVSTIFLSDALDPSDEAALWDEYRYRRWTARDLLPPDRPEAVFLGPDLLRLLGLAVDDTVVLLATTRHGQMNAVDATVWGTYATFSDEMNDKYVRLPLGLAQSLYDTDGCERVCVLCDDVASVDDAARSIAEGARALGLDVETRTWVELSQYYQKAKGFLDVVFLFLFSITAVIVVMGTVNTMTMSVYERTREIGTLRAIGFKPAYVVALFALEGGILGVLGAGAGLILTVLGRLAVEAAHITYQPPGVAEAVQVEVDLVPAVLATAFAVFVALAVVSAALPARRAGRLGIVDALGHV
jgi:putative ABC transport system permease protein